MSTDLDRLIDTALAEDLGQPGDVTAAVVIPEDATGTAYLVGRDRGVLSGRTVVERVFAHVDHDVEVRFHLQDGDTITPGAAIAEVHGNARSLLAGERTALNLLTHLCGVATQTRRVVERVADLGTAVVDTRKTLPGLRAVQKQAVVHGGGTNHRFGLYDAIMVKDNHIGLAGGLQATLERLAEHRRHLLPVEVEVDDLDQLRTVLAFDAERVTDGLRPVVQAVLLDNMDAATATEGVRLVRAHPAPVLVELSGGITEETARELAESGCDALSIGSLTHSVIGLDIGLDLQLRASAQGRP